MTNYNKLYWLTRLDSIHGFLLTALIIATFFALATFLWAWFDDDYFLSQEEKQKRQIRLDNAVKFRKYIIIFILFCSLFTIFLPTQKEAIFIIAGGKTMDFIEQDSSVQKLPSQATEIIAKYLDNKINELKEKTK